MYEGVPPTAAARGRPSALTLRTRSGLQQVPDFALHGADHVLQGPFSIDAGNARAREGEATQMRDALTDEGGIHVGLSSHGRFGADLEFDDKVGWKAVDERVGRTFEFT
jgi:hypothetical protein